MPSVRLIIAAAMVLLGGCAGTARNPVPADLGDRYTLADIETGLSSQTTLPARYHSAVLDYMEHGMAAEDRAAFDVYAAGKGGLTETNAADLFLAWLVETGLRHALAETYRGPRAAQLSIAIEDASFPNLASMMVVGDLISVDYSLRLSDAGSGATLVTTTKPISKLMKEVPIGGVIGLTIRGITENRLILDLESVAEAVAVSAAGYLTEEKIPASVAGKLSVAAE